MEDLTGKEPISPAPNLLSRAVVIADAVQDLIVNYPAFDKLEPKLVFKQPISVGESICPEFRNRVPAEVRSDHQSNRIIYFDSETFTDLVEDYDCWSEQEQDLLMGLYIGAGIARELFTNRIPVHDEVIEGFLSIMKDPSRIFHLGWETPLLDDTEVFNTVREIVSEDDTRVATINGLRLAFGAYLLAMPKQVQEQTQELFQKYIKNLLTKKRTYAEALSSLSLSKDVIERSFANQIPNEVLAGAFPMTGQEISTIIKQLVAH